MFSCGGFVLTQRKKFRSVLHPLVRPFRFFQDFAHLALSGTAFVLMIVLFELIFFPFFWCTIINMKVAGGSNAQERREQPQVEVGEGGILSLHWPCQCNNAFRVWP